jgi:multidrug efflux pump subunit AcrA (membrane-fusion protein)
MPSTTRPVPSPPASAVARDSHWAAKLARLRARQLPEHVLQLCDDLAAKKRLDQAKLNVARLRIAAAEADAAELAEETEAAEVELRAAQEAFDAVSLTLTFKALPRPVLDGLIKRFPPTEEQAEEGDTWNPETFPAALTAAAHIERDESGQTVEGLSEADAQDLLDSWSVSESNALFAAAWQAQQITRASTAELGKD